MGGTREGVDWTIYSGPTLHLRTGLSGDPCHFLRLSSCYPLTISTSGPE